MDSQHNSGQVLVFTILFFFPTRSKFCYQKNRAYISSIWHIKSTISACRICQEALMNAMNEELPRIQEQVYYGHINSQTDVLDKFLSESGVQRYNPKVYIGTRTTSHLYVSMLSFSIYATLLLSSAPNLMYRSSLMGRPNQNLYLWLHPSLQRNLH